MRVKRWLLAGIALCLLTGMRDPFKPEVCRISELSQWRYQGIVSRRAHHRCNKRRAKEMATGAANDVLENGWTITADARRTNAGYRTNCNRHNGCGNGKEIQMKQWIAALLLMLIPSVRRRSLRQKVTLMVDDVPVAQVLQALAEQEKLNLVVSPDVSGTVSLHDQYSLEAGTTNCSEKRRTDNAPRRATLLSAFHCLAE